MKEQNKILGDERRDYILETLKNSNQPITGGEFASKTNVSRQVIVGDISLLKARNEPIIATSQGYLYFKQSSQAYERIVACYHPPERTEEELNLLVDLGVTVKDVTIEHPVYGDLTASLMVSNRHEVKLFIEKIKSTNASFLSELTEGIHLHTIHSSSEETLNMAVDVLKKANFIVIP